jgi:signal transduction histidine kinase
MAGDISQEQRDYIRTIKDKGESLLELIGSLLDISKIEAGAFKLNVSEMKISEVIEGAMTSVVPQMTKKNIKLEISKQDDLPVVSGDRDKLRQAIVNLLGNAVKFTPSGGNIKLAAHVFEGTRKYSGDDGRFGPGSEKFLRIDVADTGIGIPEDKIALIFNAFYQVDNSITREFGGTGLGLSIVKRFIEAHRGEVWVESRENQGTTFSLLIPLEAPPVGTVPLSLNS